MEITMPDTTDQGSNRPNLEEAREHFHTARDAMRKSMEALIPAGYLENRRAARKEMLLGLRKMLDAAIEHVEKQQSK
jgi:hypothetical protein